MWLFNLTVIPLYVQRYFCSHYTSGTAIINKLKAELHALRSCFLHSFTHFLLSFIHFGVSLPSPSAQNEMSFWIRESIGETDGFWGFSGDSLVESTGVWWFVLDLVHVGDCKGERWGREKWGGGQRESEGEKDSQHRSWKMHGGCGVSLPERKPQRRGTDRVFLNSVTLAVSMINHMTGLQLSCATAQFIGPHPTLSWTYLTRVFYVVSPKAVAAWCKCTSLFPGQIFDAIFPTSSATRIITWLVGGHHHPVSPLISVTGFYV